MAINQIFEIVLALERPLGDKNLVMTTTEGGIQNQMDIYLDCDRDSKFHAEKTHVKVEQNRQFPEPFQDKCNLNGRGHRIQIVDENTETVKVPWPASGSVSTYLIESVNKVSMDVEITVGFPQLLLNMYSFWTNRAKQENYNLLNIFQWLAKPYSFREWFNEFFEFKDKKTAGTYLSFQSYLKKESKMSPFKDRAKSSKVLWFGIVNNTETKLNNGILEGVNSKIKLVKTRVGRGRIIFNFFNRFYFIGENLKPISYNVPVKTGIE